VAVEGLRAAMAAQRLRPGDDVSTSDSGNGAVLMLVVRGKESVAPRRLQFDQRPKAAPTGRKRSSARPLCGRSSPAGTSRRLAVREPGRAAGRLRSPAAREESANRSASCARRPRSSTLPKVSAGTGLAGTLSGTARPPARGGRRRAGSRTAPTASTSPASMPRGTNRPARRQADESRSRSRSR